jgi:Arc/MetJ family transcription regulator
MASTVKRSVTLDADLDAELTRRFGLGGKSRFLNDAARDALARLRMLELLERFDAEDGPVPEAIRAEIAALPRPS